MSFTQVSTDSRRGRMSPLHNIHSLIPRSENDFGPENRPEESTPRWVEKPLEGQEHAFEAIPLPTRLGLKPEGVRVIAGEVVDLMAALRESVERTKKQRKAPSKRKAS